MGKTTLKKRLLKTIKNLITSGVVNPSGGLEKPMIVIIGETRECVTVVIESDLDWKPQHDLLDETQIVLTFIDKSHQSPPTSCPTTVLPKPVSSTQFPAPAMLAPATPVATTAVPSKSDPDSPTPREGEAETLDDAKKLMQEVLSSRKLRSIKDIEKTTTLYIMDTGGQPEFHEIMPIILNGPALHLIFFNLAFDLDEPIPIRFCHQDGTDSTITYMSSYTGKQMIFQLLSSLYYFSKSLSPDIEPAAVLIGTHLDQLKREDVMKINDSFNQLFNNIEFHDQGFLTYPTKDESTIFTPVNNYSGDEEEIHRLQAFLRQVIDSRFSQVELPSSWLFFHLLLRHHYENSPGVCTLADCQVLARGCGLDEKDVPQVLQYIHRHLGTILFYEEVQGLNELVICDPNVLFKSIYHLVAVSFGGDKGYHTAAAQIRKTGEIQAQVMERISTKSNNPLLKNEHIIELLKHFKILTELPSDYDDKIVYFMPCLLHPSHSLALTCEELQALHPPPLLVRFKGNYIPMGVFSALVVKLIENSWKPDSKSRYRNHIVFYTDDDFVVGLIVHSAYMEFRIRITNHREKSLAIIHQLCTEVCKTVVDTLISVLDLHEHTKKTKFQLGFYCSGSFQDNGQPHFCRLSCQKDINPRAFVSSDPPHCQEQCHLPPESNIWLEQWKVCCELLCCLLKVGNFKCLYFCRNPKTKNMPVRYWIQLTVLSEQVMFLI